MFKAMTSPHSDRSEFKASEFSREQLLVATDAQVAGDWSAPNELGRVWTDTRSLQPGDFFLPLSGQNFDGHEYLEQAFQKGAVGAFVEESKFAKHSEWRALPNLLLVPDATVAYLQVANFYRRAINPMVIAVTGSSGKTTTKEMLFAALSPLRRCVKTQKNFNNEIGVAQTLLSLTPDTELLIVEMGMRGPRQIAPLSLAAQPDAAIIVNVGPAHIEFLGSLEAIAEAKLEIAEGLNPQDGLLVINGDDKQLRALVAQRWPHRLHAYRLDQAEDLRMTAEGSWFRYRSQAGEQIEVRLTSPGRHLVANALGVLAVGEGLGFRAEELAVGLAQFQPAEGRGGSQSLVGFNNVEVVNDAYNANPQSAQVALDAFLSMQSGELKPLIILLGGMKELGDFSEAYHRALGRWLSEQAKIAALFTIGEEAAWIRDEILTVRIEAEGEESLPFFDVWQVEDVEAAAIALLQRRALLDNSILYLKGSRAYHLERLPELLSAALSSSERISS
jgi:UDP-N-acetylmuramoyl-tripeptide--D-alanyl-D-alanine ligase